ncbi:amidase [Microbacterium natoriense]|uniref:Amidase n=1 Tax=Microbacterium natoriense TaxID=284570 RepID=A0AAW8EZ02_9MICO|nr:amidase [Microbacterium natoriense]MDQ0648035.1 amidase [Microbacterium natoriense]
MPAPHDLTALELRSAYERRELGVVEVISAALDRARLDDLGAFTTLNPEQALDQASAAQLRIDTNTAGPLTGVPTSIKDLEPTRGIRTTLGSAVFADWIPDFDDIIVTTMREAGLVSLGKTTVPELGAACYTEPAVAAPSRSPYAPERSAAGSSGGAAVAVSARLVPVSQGSDTAGSLRSPASACGVVGFKPSRGLLTGGLTGADGIGLSSKGPLARTVRDTAALLDAMATAAPVGTVHPARRGGFLTACDEEVPVLRVVITDGSISGGPVDSRIEDACSAAGAALERLGHRVERRHQSVDPDLVRGFTQIFSALAAAKPVPDGAEPRLRPIVRHLRERARSTESGELAAAILTVQSRAGAWAEQFRDADIVIAPTITRLPAMIGELRNDADPAAELEAMTRFTGNTIIANATGFPAVSLPLGWTEDGIPLGVMLTARWGRDDLLLAVSALLERALPWSTREPCAI